MVCTNTTGKTSIALFTDLGTEYIRTIRYVGDTLEIELEGGRSVYYFTLCYIRLDTSEAGDATRVYEFHDHYIGIEFNGVNRWYIHGEVYDRGTIRWDG